MLTDTEAVPADRTTEPSISEKLRDRMINGEWISTPQAEREYGVSRGLLGFVVSGMRKQGYVFETRQAADEDGKIPITFYRVESKGDAPTSQTTRPEASSVAERETVPGVAPTKARRQKLYTCPECPHKSPTTQGLGIHRRIKHGVIGDRNFNRGGSPSSQARLNGVVELIETTGAKPSKAAKHEQAKLASLKRDARKFDTPKPVFDVTEHRDRLEEPAVLPLLSTPTVTMLAATPQGVQVRLTIGKESWLAVVTGYTKS